MTYLEAQSNQQWNHSLSSQPWVFASSFIILLRAELLGWLLVSYWLIHIAIWDDTIYLAEMFYFSKYILCRYYLLNVI